MDNFSASIHQLFSHRQPAHQPDTEAWLEGSNIHQLNTPPSVKAIEEALNELRTRALRNEIVEIRITVGLYSGKVQQTVITP